MGEHLEVQEEGSGWGHGKQGRLGEPPLVNKQLAPTATPRVRPSACLGGAFLRAPSLCLLLGGQAWHVPPPPHLPLPRRDWVEGCGVRFVSRHILMEAG